MRPRRDNGASTNGWHKKGVGGMDEEERREEAREGNEKEVV